MKFLRLVGAALAALSGTALLVVPACGGDKPADPKTAADGQKPDTTKPVASTRPGQHDPESVPNTKTASNVQIAKEILEKCGIPEPEAYFGYDSAALRAQDTGPLDKVAICFVSGPLKGRGLRVVGHADPRGGSEYNMMLGQSRADGVANYLIKKGMTPKTAESTSRGAMDATGTDEATWAKDRRVDVLLGQ